MRIITFRKIINRLHLWLGLFVGLIVIIVAVTGCLYAFEQEIRSLYEKHAWYVDVPQDQTKKPLAELREKARTLFFKSTPEVKSVSYESAVFYKDPERSISFLFYNADPYVYKEIFINPYTGQILLEKNHLADFFTIVLELHRNLLLGETGKQIVDYASLIFLFMLISGIILWWPRNASARKKRFSIKWNLNPKRTNYDLHNVLGFYASWVAVFVVLTGFVWAFTWFSTAVDWTANGGRLSPPHEELTSDTTHTAKPIQPVSEIVYKYAMSRPDEVKRFWLGLPINKTDYYNLVSYYSEDTYYKHEHTPFDQYSGKIIEEMPYDKSTSGDKILSMAYDIHIGKILGLPGQIAVFFASLIVASLPITGIRIWLGRRKNAVRKAERYVVAERRAG